MGELPPLYPPPTCEKPKKGEKQGIFIDASPLTCYNNDLIMGV